MALVLSSKEYYYKLDNMVLSGCQVLKSVFQKRWKNETGRNWENSEAQAKIFIEGLGECVFKKAAKQQKIKIVQGNLEEWDMTLVALVLCNFGNTETYRVENKAVKILTGLRNELSHHPTKKLSQDDYNQKVDSFRTTLKLLQVEVSEVDTLIEKAGICSSELALKTTNKLLKKGEDNIKKEEFDVAIYYFDEATTMPSLLPVHQGMAYEKRADCYLKLATHKKNSQSKYEADKCCEQALLDATEALELNTNSWNAHHLLGKCYRWKNDFKTATHHYNQALAISPAEDEVKRGLHSCRSTAGIRNREDNLDPRNAPMNLKERVDYLAASTGIRMTEDQFMFFGDQQGHLFPGQEHVHKGHQYQNGWCVPPNDQKAFWHFAKAAELGNAEGIYNLGRCYEKGVRVPKNLETAIKLYEKAANMSPELSKKIVTTKKNVGVISAQHMMGLCYAYGIGVTQDYKKAANWYKRAAENGMGNAANNLARLYATGTGVPVSGKMAEMYWNQAVILKNYNAAELLMYYHIQHLEVGRAETMFEIGKMLGNSDLHALSEEQFKTMSEKSSKKRNELEKEVIEFEKDYCLDIKGLTFLERSKRISAFNCEMKILMCQFFNFIFQRFLGDNDFHESESHDIILTEKAAQTQLHCEKLTEFLLEKQSLTDLEENFVIETLYDICCLDFSAALFPDQILDKLLKITENLLKVKCDGSRSEFDMKIRLCYVVVHYQLTKCVMPQSMDMFGIEVLKKGIEMYPENPHYHLPVATLCGQKMDYKSAVYYAEAGLQKFPDNFELFYVKGVFLLVSILVADECNSQDENLKREEQEKAISAFQSFTNFAPKDHRNVGGAYYMLATLNARNESLESFEIFQHYFMLGQQSELKMRSDFMDLFEVILDLPSSSNLRNPNRGESILERKQYLCDPVRRGLILEHRNFFAKMRATTTSFSWLPNLQQTSPKSMSCFTPITLKEMNPTTNHIYEGRMIDLTIIDEPGMFVSIHLVAEDENGDVTRVYIYNVSQNQEAYDVVGVGCKIAILNPYMRIGSSDETNGLRNDDPNCIVYLGKVKNLCRFCGEENVSYSCGKCRRANYCSRECQKLDWTLMKHKLICSN